MSTDDWRYSEDKLKLRGEVLKILLAKYGGQMEGVIPKYSTKSIFECDFGT
jgi:polyhydroxyalkanoate synthesis regulator protein